MASTGRILHVVSRRMGAAIVAASPVGDTVLDVDSASDFNDLGGFLSIGSSVLAYSAVDHIADTVTLTAPLASAVPSGTPVWLWPAAVEKWAMVMPDQPEEDSIWCLVPHDLKALLGPDGWRAKESQESVQYSARDKGRAIVTDIYNRQPQLNAEAVPDAFITETMISPGAITTPLLAANSVSTINLQFGAATGEKLSADALDGKTITGALIRTAASGSRVELRNTGLLQYDALNTLITQIGVDGNKFTGSIDATSIIIRDSLQMFGKNNKMGPGSVMTLTASSNAPSQPPALAWEYEEGPRPNVGTGLNGFYATSLEQNSNTNEISGTGNFWTYSRIFKGAAWYQFPSAGLSPSGDPVAEYKTLGSLRISLSTSAGQERVVCIGEAHNATTAAGGAYPIVQLRVYDDNGMSSSGTIAPTLKAGLDWNPFSWSRTQAIVPMVYSSLLRNIFGVLSMDTSTSPATISFQRFQYTESGTPSISYLSIVTGSLLTMDGERIAGGVYFDDQSLVGLDGLASGNDYLLVMTNFRNIVWNLTANSWTTISFPTTYSKQFKVMFRRIPWAYTLGAMYSYDWLPGGDIRTFKYENNFKNISETWWGSFAYQGDVPSPYNGYLTEQSPLASIAYRPRAKLRLSIPGLPAPAAGAGQPRDPAKDPYRWVYYLGRGPSAPVRTAMYRQPVQPTQVSGVPLEDTSITLGDYPTWSGTVPSASTTFPASTPAQIKSDVGGKILLDGNGDSNLRNVNASGAVQVTGSGHAVDPLFTERVQIHRRALSSSISMVTHTEYNIGLPTMITNVGSISYNGTTGEFTIGVTGRYRINAQAYWGPGSDRRFCTIYINGVAKTQAEGSATASTFVSTICDLTIPLTAGDKVLLKATQTQGSNANLYGDSGAFHTYMSIERVL